MIVVSRFSACSQQDLTTADLIVNRLSSSHSPSRNEEGTEIDARGKELATRCWQEDEEFLAKDKIAEWLGKQSVFSSFSTYASSPRWAVADIRVGAQSTKLR